MIKISEETTKLDILLTNLKRKSLLLGLTLIYLVVLIFLRWGVRPIWDLFFLAGGLLGVYFLDLADILFKVSPSPFKNVLFQAIFVPFSLFVLTSSGSLFGAGLTLSIFLSMLFGQWQEFGKNGNINNWFWIVKVNFPPKTQQIYFGAMLGIFIFLSLLFV